MSVGKVKSGKVYNFTSHTICGAIVTFSQKTTSGSFYQLLQKKHTHTIICNISISPPTKTTTIFRSIRRKRVFCPLPPFSTKQKRVKLVNGFLAAHKQRRTIFNLYLTDRHFSFFKLKCGRISPSSLKFFAGGIL